MTPETLSAARELLRRNDRGGKTLPSPALYPHQWAWDSAFAAIGWACFDTERALRELEVLFEGQWPDGRVPHISFSEGDQRYFPGPAMWGHPKSSSITNPPVWALALRRLVDTPVERDRLRALAERSERSLEFFSRARDPLGWGGVATVHPWESGMDNSPAWDLPLGAIDPADAPPFRRIDNTVVTDAAQRPSDDDYKRYIVLVRAIADCDFGPGPFAVYDPGFTALRIWAEESQAEACDRLGVATNAPQRAELARQCLRDRLWDEPSGRYAFYDATARRFMTPDVIGGYLPLLVEDDPTRRAALLQGLRERYDTAWPVPTAAPSSAEFNPTRYWRGPSWVNINWILTHVPELRDELSRRTLEMIQRGGFREYYHPLSGQGLGAHDFTWTAALALDLSRQREELP